MLDYIYSKRNSFGIYVVVTNKLKDRKILEPLLETNLYQQEIYEEINPQFTIPSLYLVVSYFQIS